MSFLTPLKQLTSEHAPEAVLINNSIYRHPWRALIDSAFSTASRAAVLISCALVCSAAPRPNIIFLLSDDLGYGDLGVSYQNLRHQQARRSEPAHFTPAIDRLAAEGMRLPHHYCPAPVCAPSRASLLLGVHQGHANVRDNQFDKALERNHTLATVLKGAGYATACIGKWGLQGLSSNVPPAWPAHPLNRGFDYYYGYIRHTDGHEHYPKEGLYRKPKEVWENWTEVSTNLDKCYTTDLFGARAKQWIQDHQTTNSAQPFFLYLAFDTPHAVLELPTQAYPSGSGLKGGLQWLGLPGRMINTASGKIDSWYHPDYARATWDHDTNAATAEVPWPNVYKRYATCVRRIDNTVDDLVQLLKDLGIDRQTLIVFTSDNGPSRESYLKEDYEPTFFHSFGPFDGIKRDCWEGGLRVGAIARWPDGIAPNQVSPLPSAFWDWMPTFAELAGVPPPARTDGRSLLPTLTGQGRQSPPTIYFEYFEGGKTPNYNEFASNHRGRLRKQMQAIRLGDFMGVRYNVTNQAQAFEIYDVTRDPKQTNDLAACHPELQRRMKDQVLQVRRPGGETTRPYDQETIAPVRGGKQRNDRLNYAFFEGVWAWLPDFSSLTPKKEGHISSLDLTRWAQRSNFGIRYSGYFQAPFEGEYTFYLQSDSGAQLRLHKALVIDDDFNHDGSIVSASIKLKAGLHPLELSYRHTQGPILLNLEFAGPGVPRRPISKTSFSAP